MVYRGSSGRQGRQGWQPQRQGWQTQTWTAEPRLAWKRGEVDAFALPAGGIPDLTDDRPGRPTPGGTPDLTDPRRRHSWFAQNHTKIHGCRGFER